MVKLLLDARALLGESPVWHAAEARLYWVDIDGRKIHRTDPASGADEVMGLAEQVVAIGQPVLQRLPRAVLAFALDLVDGQVAGVEHQLAGVLVLPVERGGRGAGDRLRVEVDLEVDRKS